MEGSGGVIEGLPEGKIWLEMSSTDADELERYGARAWSSMVAKRLEDECGDDLRTEHDTSDAQSSLRAKKRSSIRC